MSFSSINQDVSFAASTAEVFLNSSSSTCVSVGVNPAPKAFFKPNFPEFSLFSKTVENMFLSFTTPPARVDSSDKVSSFGSDDIAIKIVTVMIPSILNCAQKFSAEDIHQCVHEAVRACAVSGTVPCLPDDTSFPTEKSILLVLAKNLFFVKDMKLDVSLSIQRYAQQLLNQ